MSVAFGPFTMTSTQLTMNFNVKARDGGTLGLTATYYEQYPDDGPSPDNEPRYSQVQVYANSYTRYRDDDPDALDLLITVPHPGEFFALIKLPPGRVTNLDELHLIAMTQPLTHSCPSSTIDYEFLTLTERVFHDAFFGEDDTFPSSF